MRDRSCDSRRGQLAMGALGRLDGGEQADLDAHLTTCEECRASFAELRSAVGALDASTVEAITAPVPSVPPHLTEAVFADLDTGDPDVARPRRRRRLLIACGSVAAVVIGALLATVALTRSDPPTKTIALRGTGGVTATAVLVEQSWGTSLTIHEQGLAPGQTYTVSMDDQLGHWWAAGSYRATGSGPVDATMACAARYSSIYEIRVTGQAGRTVLTNAPSGAY